MYLASCLEGLFGLGLRSQYSLSATSMRTFSGKTCTRSMDYCTLAPSFTAQEGTEKETELTWLLVNTNTSEKGWALGSGFFDFAGKL